MSIEPAARRGRPFSASVPTRRTKWLYVLPSELGEAMAMGARHVEGDARLLMPEPLPPSLCQEDFRRWQGPDAVRIWLDMFACAVLEAETGEGLAHPPQARADRVYLYVPISQAKEVQAMPGVAYDPRENRYFVCDPAYLHKVFSWLTPQAQRREQIERANRKLEEKTLLEKAVAYSEKGEAAEKTVASIK